MILVVRGIIDVTGRLRELPWLLGLWEGRECFARLRELTKE